MIPDHYDANFSNVAFNEGDGGRWVDKHGEGWQIFEGRFRGSHFFIMIDLMTDAKNYMVPVRPSTRDLPVGSVIVVKYDDRSAEAYLRSSLSSWAAATPDKTTTIDVTGMENVICRETDWEVIFTPEPSDTFDDH